MVLPKDPRLMSDEELSDWAVSLIGRKAPESNFLDYKREVSIKGEKDKIEVCKDVSSFANENGGILLYGVPELKESGIPVPADLSVCGFDMPMDLPKRIEDILIDVIEPPLPELSIRVLKSKKLTPKSLLFIHHPESWNKPHMVQAYNDFRFYRRGEFQSALMTEKQVEAAYAFRKSSLDNAGRFFEMGDFRAFPKAGRFLRVVLCPRFTILRREAMAPSKFLAWSTKNPFPKMGSWLPFLMGGAFNLGKKVISTEDYTSFDYSTTAQSATQET